MSSRMGTGRWSDVTDEVQPFGMSFVDIVASALICVVALLILWLQFIDPLGYIPGHSARSGSEAQTNALPGKNGKPGYTMPGLLISILAKWPNDLSEDVRVENDCGGSPVFLRSNANSYAAATVAITSLTSPSCFIWAKPIDGKNSRIEIFVRAITDGNQLFETSFTADSGHKNVLADPRSPKLKEALGETAKPWAYDWSPVSP